MVNGISELDLRRLKKERPDLETELVSFFAAALERFVHSPQYMVLRALRISVFIDEEVLDAAGFAEATFEELVTIGVFDVCSLQTVSVELIEAFVRVLETLVSEGDDGVVGVMAETMFSAPPELEPVQTRGFDDLPYVPMSNPDREHKGKERVLAGPMLNSIEAERKLLDAFARIQNHPQVAEFAHEPLSEYWNEEWIRAPFVEALTFRQLASMKLSNLLDKRTFSQHKIQAILKCVDAVCEKYGDDSVQEVDSVPSTPLQTRSANTQAAPRATAGWKSKVSGLPFVLASAISLIEEQINTAAVPQEFVPAFFAALSDEEGALLVLEAQFGEEYLADMLDSDEAALGRKLQAARKKWRRELTNTAKLQVERIEELLQSPAVRLPLLMGGEGAAFKEQSISSLFAAALLQTLGAELAAVDEVVLTDCWTCNLAGMEIIWDSVTAQKPKSRKAYLTLISPMLPYVPQEVLEMLWTETSIKPKRARG